jgi:quinol monooxygenase YgiN
MMQALRSLQLLVQAAPGLIACRLFVDADNASAICYVEEWQSADELDRQLRSSHYDQLLSLMEEAAEPPILRLTWVSHVKGLEYLEAVRRGASNLDTRGRA